MAGTDQNNQYDGLRSFSDVKTMLDHAKTHEEICTLNQHVENRFMRDQQQLTMTDADWEEYTSLMARKVTQLSK